MKLPAIARLRMLIVIGSLTAFRCMVSGQSFNLEWSGTELVPKSTFLSSSAWTTNVPNAGLGDRSTVSPVGDTLKLNWTFGTGNRYKWAQCYINLPQAISLENYDLFGFNLKGMPGSGYVGFELKFEDGIHQAVVRWDGLAGLNRWAERISAAKKQFENSAAMDWSQVRVISLAVYAQASAQYVNTDTGSVSIHQLTGARMVDWERAVSREFINPADYTTIKENAVAALVSRQRSSGLLTTWTQDGTSWLYGQGLVLKALSTEGSWSLGLPVDAAAATAEKLALFLVSNQEPEGYWPRAWNSVTGAITVLREADGTVWMGDFPWIITGLQSYFKKSRDQRVVAAIKSGLAFLRNLVRSDGKFFTINPQTGIQSEVASCEAYAAAILSLYESGDSNLANRMLGYISVHGWDARLRCWREATYSDRIVLFANTWMSYYLFRDGQTQMGLDALSLAGKVLYTHGNGELYGMDGIVPLAVWYEGTLSYISAGGPGSIALFDQIKSRIHPDGMVSHYNENLGGMGGIWAVDWHSLDGTSWLYFTVAGKSPFDITEGNPVSVQPFPDLSSKSHFKVSVNRPGALSIIPVIPVQKETRVRMVQLDGRILQEKIVPANSAETIIINYSNQSGCQVVIVQIIGINLMESYPVFLY